MPTKAQLEAELKEAIRGRETIRKRTLRIALSAIKLAEVEKRAGLESDEILKILQKEAKSRRETIEDARRAGRSDLVEAAENEIEILESYLPQPLTEAEIDQMARQVIEETGASGPGDMGRVMGPMMARTAGRAEGKQVSQVVQRLLQES